MRRRFMNTNSVADINYMGIEALEDGMTVSLSRNAVEYSIDHSSAWTTLAAGTASPPINKGQMISFKGTLTPTSSNGIGTFTISKKCSVYGNVMSLLFGDDFKNKNDLTGYNYTFYNLFKNCTTIIDAYDLLLPATTLANYCYYDMFYKCSSLTTAPELPATTLANYCYREMFYNCSSLTTAPELPATTLAQYCYQSMFNGCTSLTTAPELPATTLTDSCYRDMFRNCTNLTTASELPATTLANYCYSGMFYNCSSLTSAPELPATTLANGCYREMFYNCSKLNYIKALFTTTPSISYTNNWVNGVSSTGTFVKNKDATWDVVGKYGIPNGWTVKTDDEESGGGLINFTINGTSYLAEEGMTWEEWVNSSYSTEDFIIDPFGWVTTKESYYIGTEEDYVSPSDIILEDCQYLLVG